MTGAELRTLRDSLCISAEEFSHLVGVRGRTVQRWEADEWPVPADAAHVLTELDALISRTVERATQAIRETIQAAGGPPEAVTLVRYRNADLYRYRPDMKGWPQGVHGALIDRVRMALAREQIVSRIVWMRPDDYEAWRGDQHDDDALRSAWAAEQIAEP